MYILQSLFILTKDTIGKFFAMHKSVIGIFKSVVNIIGTLVCILWCLIQNDDGSIDKNGN